MDNELALGHQWSGVPPRGPHSRDLQEGARPAWSLSVPKLQEGKKGPSVLFLALSCACGMWGIVSKTPEATMAALLPLHEPNCNRCAVIAEVRA